MGIIIQMTIMMFVFYFYAYSNLNTTGAQNLKKNFPFDVNDLNDSYVEESRQKNTSGESESEVKRKVHEAEVGGSVTEIGSGCFSDGNSLCNRDGVTDKINFATTTSGDNLDNGEIYESNFFETGTEIVTTSTSQLLDAYGDTSVDDVIRGSATVSVPNNVTFSGKSTGSTTTHFTNVTTTTVDVTTTTEETSDIRFKYSPGLDDCDCDLFKNECDINCCCDQDCTVKDKSSFVDCIPAPSSDRIKSVNDYTDRFCYSTRFIYTSDKTVARVVERNRNGLFCIAVDNLPIGILHENVSPIKSVDEFDRKLKSSKRRIFGWTRPRIIDKGDHPTIVGVPLFHLNVTRYRYGDYIWTFTNYSDSYLRPLFVPSPMYPYRPFPPSLLSLTERQCYRGRPILYLKDGSYSCLRMVPKNKDDCEVNFKYIDGNFYFDKNLRVLTAPQTILNDTISISDYCSDENCADVVLLVCKDTNFLLCNDQVAVARPTFYETENGKCLSVVKNVRYLFHLNGVENITKIEIYIHLVNLSLHNTKTSFFRQRFEINFSRSVYNKSQSQGVKYPVKVSLAKSGTPGYAIGKPIITGKKADLLSGFEKENYSSQFIILSNDKRHWLGLPQVASSSAGECDAAYARRNIMFLENMKSECLLRVPLHCDFTRQKTRETLLGDYYSSNVTDKKRFNIYVSSYGDPDPTDPTRWVPVLIRKISSSTKSKGQFNGQELCNDVFTGVDIKILYSYVGAIERPQAKIVGSILSLRFDDNALVESGSDFEIFRMTGSVKFVDISKPDDAIIKFADPPVYEIKLPQDFFYPFLSFSFKVSPSFFIIFVSVFLTS